MIFNFVCDHWRLKSLVKLIDFGAPLEEAMIIKNQTQNKQGEFSIKDILVLIRSKSDKTYISNQV